MHEWLWFSILVLLCWGVLGVVQKLATSYIPAETALIWAAAGFLLLEPLVFPTSSIFQYSAKNLSWALLNGVANGLGFFSLLAAMRYGGKASVVEPLSALYPAFVVLLAPFLLHERIHPLHALGIACAIVAGLLLGVEKPAVK
jgi:bacterial/archaeal transporter family protein